METITLREVALRLAKIKQPTTRKIDSGQLLSLLKSGDLKAGFEFPGVTKRWVAIEPNYWLTIDSDKFRSIRSDGGYTFKVGLRDFADTYLRLVLNDSSNESLKAEFRVVLGQASRKYEVVVQAEEWKKYLDNHGLNEPPFDTPPKGKGGRNPKAAWRQLSVTIPAYLLAHHDKTHEPPNHETAAGEIHQITMSTYTIDANSLPAPGTIKDVIGEIYQRKIYILKK